ncbi:MAG: hypothetical protein IJ845_09455 [Bacteroidaceae bacterium]|nr:hypothetical protein [Bacteroidaceae bacterium]
MATAIQERSPKKMLKVSFAEDDVICYKNATETFVEVLSRLTVEQLESIKLEIGHLPMISKEVYPKFKEYMKPLGNGLFVNIQSDTDQKYIQLLSIKQQLNLSYKVEKGTDFLPMRSKVVQRTKKSKEKLLVKLPSGEYLGNENPIDTFLNTIWEIGIEEIQRQGLELGGKKLITTTKMYNNQIEVGPHQWLTVPNQTKDKYKWLRVISAMMHSNMEISLL